MRRDWLFWLGIACGLLGWVFFGAGAVLFPLSLFFITRSDYRPSFFILLVTNDIVGFMLSLYFDVQYIIQHIV